MRKVVASYFLSLDGVAEEPEEFVDMAEVDEVMQESMARGIAAQDAVLLGRGTYDAWAGFWPGSDIEPFATLSTRSPSTSSHPRRSTGTGPTRLWPTVSWPGSSGT
jgi:dihydrofolate reductase